MIHDPCFLWIPHIFPWNPGIFPRNIFISAVAPALRFFASFHAAAMAIAVGAEVVIKATETAGVAKLSNGHASHGRIGEMFFSGK